MEFKKLVLNVMIGGKIAEVLDQHQQLGLHDLDIKMDWSGSMIESSTAAIVADIAAGMQQRSLSTWCLSSCIGNCRGDSDDAYIAEQDRLLNQLITFAQTLKPRFIRLILPRGDASTVNDQRIIEAYHRWCTQIIDAGYQVLIENEIGGSIGRDPALVKAFFENINANDQIKYIWDIANQWQEGRYPSLADYDTLRDIIGLLHVKGGQWNNADDKVYAWKSHLDDSDWPVAELCRAALADGLEAICINPPHGQAPDNWSYSLEKDLTFLDQLQELSHV